MSPRRILKNLFLITGSLLTLSFSEKITQVPTDLPLTSPFAIDSDAAGNLFVVEMADAGRILKIEAGGKTTVLGGPPNFKGMHSLAMLSDQVLLIADTWNCRIQKINLSSGAVATFAGTGEKGFGGDAGPALSAKFGAVYDIGLDTRGKRILIADLDNRRIRAVSLETGLVSTVAGNGEKGIPKDGSLATDAPLLDPRAVAADANGRIYILERGGHCLRLVDEKGIIKTVAGTGQKGFFGDGGDALQTKMNGPKHLWVETSGDVLIADAENHAIRRYLSKEGRLTLVAGTGKKGSEGMGGAPELAELNRPHGIFAAGGVIYIADSENNRILKIEK